MDEKEQKLIVDPADKIPNLMTINKDGKIVFAEPKPMCTVRVPKGHTGWIYIELVKLSPQTEACEDYLCLGIRRQGENKIVGPLYSVGDHKSKYVGLADDEVMELVPMLSKTKLSEGYTGAEAGEEVNVTGLTIPIDGIFDFGSVYRINMKYHGDILWVERNCDLGGSNWYDQGYLDRGPVNGKEDQLLIINWGNGQLKSSSDGIHWEDAGNIHTAIGNTSADNWDVSPKYGNGIWCVPRFDGEIRRSTDGAKTWQVAANLGSVGTYAFTFGDNKFVIVTQDGKIHTSIDAVNWNHTAVVFGIAYGRVLGYQKEKRTCNDTTDVFFSADGNEWKPTESNLPSLLINSQWGSGGIYANGNFYAVDSRTGTGSVLISADGKDWTKIFNFSCGNHNNVSYLGNKLYMLNVTGTHCHFGLFYPNDMYDSL